jgi:hypothetical protein
LVYKLGVRSEELGVLGFKLKAGKGDSLKKGLVGLWGINLKR